MSYSTEPATATNLPRSKRKKGPSVKLVLLVWVLLIAAGTFAAYQYSLYLKQSMLEQLDATIQAQVDIIQADYSSQISELTQQVKELQAKVDTFNELLNFTKDNASDKTDNSNKLYTQLNEVKNQLNKLQKQMELLK